MEQLWLDPTVFAACIQAVGTVVSALIAAIAAAVIGKRFLDRKRLAETLRTALQDIEFLLLVEEEHCKVHRLSGDSNRQRVRDVVTTLGYRWSGRFTPGRSKSLIESLKVDS